MELLLISILISVCLFVVLIGFIQGNGLIWYPFLFAVVIIGWVVPQILAISEAGIAPGNSVSKTVLMIILSYVSGWAGYSYRTGRVLQAATRAPQRQYTQWGLNLVMVGVASFGAYFFFKLSEIAPEVIALYGGQWTGIITIYAFFASSLVCGFAISLSSLIKKVSLIPFLTALFCLSFILHRVVVSGRREDAVQLGIFLTLFLYFKYNRLIPRMVQVLFVMAGALFVTSVGDYRAVMLDTSTGLTWTGAGLNEVLSINFVSNFSQSDRDAPSLELFNAALIIEGAERALSFDFGLSLWNAFVHAYVPGQIIGADIKSNLAFHFHNVRDDFGFAWHVGTTSTGFSNAFRSFWYLGAFIFFIIGRIVRYWMCRAQNGDTLGAVMIMLLLPESLLAITHHTNGFFLAFIFLYVFVIAPLRLVSKRSTFRHQEA